MLIKSHDRIVCMVKYFVTDIDHTLFDVEIGIHPKNIETLIKLQESGVILILASGRTITSMLNVAKAVNLEKYGGYIIGANGTMVQKANEKQPFVQYDHSIEDLNEYIQEALKLGLHFSLEQDGILYYSHLDHSVIYERDHCEIPVKPMSEIDDEVKVAFPKLCLHRENSDYPKLLDQFIEKYHSKAYCERFSDSYMDVMPFGHSKLSGIEEILKREGDDLSHVAAIGDSVNDRIMLTHVGLSAAVANAAPFIQEVADIIVSDVRKAGVAEFANLVMERNKL